MARMMMTRVQFDMPSEKMEELDQLMSRAGVSSRRELFNNALTLLDWAIEQRSNGRKILSYDDGNDAYRELSMPVLDSLGRASTKLKLVRGGAEIEDNSEVRTQAISST